MLRKQFIVTLLIANVLAPNLPQAQGFEKVEIRGQFPVEQLRKNSEFIQRIPVITSQKQLYEVWKKLKGGEKPRVHFETSLLIPRVRDAADPNRHQFSARVKDGKLELLTLSTLIGFERSDKTITTLIEIPRKGITAIRHYNPVTRKYEVTLISLPSDP